MTTTTSTLMTTSASKPPIVAGALAAATSTPAAATSTLVDALVDTFNRERILYSHWKSNIDLAQAAVGEIDLDLLIDCKSWPRAMAILSNLGFKPAVVRWGPNPPSIRHFYGLDPDTKNLIHVHLFSRVLTGESFVKSHLLPFSNMLLENVYYSGQIRVASKSAELVLFTMRMFVKYGSLLDIARLWRKPDDIRKELRWLRDGSDFSEALSLLSTYCPVVDEPLFVECVNTLDSDRSLFGRMKLARKVRRQLKVYAKYSNVERFLAYGQVLWAEIQRRTGTKRKNKVFQNGGGVIAFVGADATGKSTLVTETGRWLGDTFALSVIHTGKPPSSALTAPVNITLNLARRFITLQRMTGSQTQTSVDDDAPSLHRFRGLPSLLYALRSVTLAWDRQRLILVARRRAAKGEIIVCDRYPSRTVGMMDSPRLEETEKTGRAASLYNYLARLEQKLYRRIPPPDIVLKLRVSIETAKMRNSARDGQDDEAYLVARHRQSRQWQMAGTRYLYDIDTEQTLDETISSVKEAIWKSL